MLLFALWEIGKLIARHRAESPPRAAPDVAAPAKPKQAGTAAA